MKRLVALFVVLLTAPLFSAFQDNAWDFVPGEKILIYDDYTDMPKGGAPPHWKVRGGALRLVDGRLVVATSQETRMWPNVVKWPKNFTLEMDIAGKAVQDPAESTRVLDWSFEANESWVWHASLDVNGEGACSAFIEIATPGESQNVRCKFLTDRPNAYAIWVQEGRLRIYMNGERLIDLNQLDLPFQTAFLRIDSGSLPVSLGPVRIAESSPDISKTLFATGRYITHGIQFDVNSDVLRPESRPVLELIAETLRGDAALKLRIEGHTDSTGEAARNLDLSKRRAESVKKALVGQFGIDAGRLTTDGFGDTRPIGKNETPQGRAENRRVEFVKMQDPSNVAR